MKYYISNPSAEKGFEELTETEWKELVGEDAYRGYARKLYCDLITLNDVPEEYRDEVVSIVNAKIARWGEYSQQEISERELEKMIEEAL